VGIHERNGLADIDGDFPRHEVTSIVTHDPNFDRPGRNLSDYCREILVAIASVIILIVATASSAPPSSPPRIIVIAVRVVIIPRQN
jgi:hypothetical protein